ncbi:MAG: HAMP domain-containing protein [Nitrospiraceae bacterium]|nr:MAG: HAMP domain-containing protein [Nitrospiraceae bacterium]
MTLRSKIALLTITVALSVGFFIIVSVRGVFVDAFRGELEKRGLSVAGNLADRVANYILLSDFFQTSRAFSEVLAKERDVEYIFVTGQEGNIVAHTFTDGIPPEILTWNPLKERESSVQLLDTEKGYIRDVGVSVFRDSRSELHLGIREDSLRETLARARRITYPLIILVVALGVVASFIFSLLITKPLRTFVEFTKVLGRGEYGKKVEVQSSDEIGYLARNFNTLSVQLQTARGKMEEAYTYTHLLEAEKLSSIGQISAGLAHELKNPLTTLKSMFQAFREQPDMTREDAEIISAEIDKIDRVMTNFLGFVKQKSVSFAEISLSDLIERVLSLAAFDIDNAGITVHRDLIDALPSVRGDRGLLEQVFLNLVLNAVQAMPGGGDIRVSGKSDDRFVEVMVWDRGGGIPSDVRARVYDPFFTTKESGTGLGLSIAYNIIKSHGGTMFFNSNEGAGTVFTVRLPREVEHGQDSRR